MNAARKGADGSENTTSSQSGSGREAAAAPASRPAQGAPGSATSGSAGGAQRGTSRAPARDEPAAGRDKAIVSWIALLVAVLLTVWEAISSLHLGGIDPANDPSAWNSFYPVSLFVTLVLGLAAAVLGIVGIAQRRQPRWPGLAGLAVGLYAFVGAVFAWVGGLMDTGSSL
ncbi:hypothetical protein [Bogoriella caseilytica]|uniref:Uncharacterized protein n=1 Tax=Bogoriella caseilytica TaxID=56055 RepID=A0A3N2BFQ3_9MICO|nr:hypothetical protein [Bogoriella caseilytica]ROR74055.1 hypothetical protein EDD31_2452 [Bogoriella caseilytica]